MGNTLIEILQLFYFDGEATLMAYLLANAVRISFDLPKDVLVFLIFSPLPYSLPSSLTKFLQSLFELLVPFLFLLCYSPFVFCIKGLWGAPFLPCEFFYLIAQEQHHVRESGLVWICFQEVWHELLVSQFGYTICKLKCTA